MKAERDQLRFAIGWYRAYPEDMDILMKSLEAFIDAKVREKLDELGPRDVREHFGERKVQAS
jgi:hypothetical protein